MIEINVGMKGHLDHFLPDTKPLFEFTVEFRIDMTNDRLGVRMRMVGVGLPGAFLRQIAKPTWIYNRSSTSAGMSPRS